jgi:threonine dehydrogenase-like Zn-dependent dehydrogenase
MRALTVRPGIKHSLELVDLPEPSDDDGPVLVETLSVGLCATDLDIVDGLIGYPPPGSGLLVIGHENLGRVLAVTGTPGDRAVSPGDLVVGVVRRPDPVPCPACAAGEWDMCRNGRYTSHGISGRHGYARERWRAAPDGLIRVDPGLSGVGVLLEPASVVAKAFEHIEAIGRRGYFGPGLLLVTGAGPVGLLVAMFGVRRGLAVHVFDRVTDGPRPKLVADLGAEYHTEPVRDTTLAPDIVVECTGATRVIADVLMLGRPASITCLVGMSPGDDDAVPVDIAAFNRRAVRQNAVVFGSVNANRRHYLAAADELAGADRDWLTRLVSRRVRLDDYREAFVRHPDDVKVVIDIA